VEERLASCGLLLTRELQNWIARTSKTL
jgi:hypothetical protein